MNATCLSSDSENLGMCSQHLICTFQNMHVERKSQKNKHEVQRTQAEQSAEKKHSSSLGQLPFQKQRDNCCDRQPDKPQKVSVCDQHPDVPNEVSVKKQNAVKKNSKKKSKCKTQKARVDQLGSCCDKQSHVDASDTARASSAQPRTTLRVSAACMHTSADNETSFGTVELSGVCDPVTHPWACQFPRLHAPPEKQALGEVLLGNGWHHSVLKRNDR